MLGIKLKDVNKIICYCFRDCTRSRDLFGLRTNIIQIKEEKVNVTGNNIIYTGELYYPYVNGSYIVLSDYELQISKDIVAFNLRYTLLDGFKDKEQENEDFMNGSIKSISSTYTIDEMAKNIGRCSYDKLLTTM